MTHAIQVLGRQNDSPLLTAGVFVTQLRHDPREAELTRFNFVHDGARIHQICCAANIVSCYFCKCSARLHDVRDGTGVHE